METIFTLVAADVLVTQRQELVCGLPTRLSFRAGRCVRVPMDYGTAAGYAEVFGGKIVHSTDIPTLSQPPNTKPRLERVK